MTDHTCPAADDPIWVCERHHQRRYVTGSGVWCCPTCRKIEDSWHEAVWPFMDAVRAIHPTCRIEITVTDDSGRSVQYCVGDNRTEPAVSA